MRIYFLLQTPLTKIRNLSTPPRTGDIVCYIRRAQDPTGEARDFLKRQNITLYFIDELLSEEITNKIDAIGSRFLKEWFINDEKDFSDLGDLSLGTSYSTELAREISPRVLIRTGEALRKLLETNPQVSGVFSDAEDGKGIYEVRPSFYPVAKTIKHVAIFMGYTVCFIKPFAAVPPAMKLGKRNSFSTVITSFLGRYRPVWVRARFNYNKNRKNIYSKPVLYSFIGRAQDVIVSELANRQKFNVVCNWLGIPGTSVLRCDHLFALPSLGDLRNVRAIFRKIRARSNPAYGEERYKFSGLGYDSILYRAVYEVLSSQIWAFLFVIAQSRKFQKTINASALLINDATNEPMGNLVSFNRDTKLKIYLLPHGMNVTKRSFFAPSVDHTHVNYLAYGSHHSGFYRAYLDENTKLQQSLVGSPLTVLMNRIRDKGPSKHGKRLLIFTFGHTQFWNSARVFAADQYYIDIFGVLPELIKEGWSVNIRSHPGGPRGLENHLIKEFEIGEFIRWDESATIDEALRSNDVIVSNITTAYYQSMYAGWPTIFYEPDYRNMGDIKGVETDPMLTGLPTAKDLERPVTNNPVTLSLMIRDSLNPDSLVSKFPKRFAGELAPRFIGPSPAKSDKVIADFLESDFFDNSESTTRLS
jgi:hypothetical protein